MLISAGSLLIVVGIFAKDKVSRGFNGEYTTARTPQRAGPPRVGSWDPVVGDDTVGPQLS